MNLIEQIKVIFFTFLFGIVFSFFYNILYSFLYNKKLIFKIIVNFFFFITFSSIYYYFIYNLNGGILHIYLLLIFIISFYLYNKLFIKIRIGWWFNKLAIF